jgi:xanthine dehydrogenase accessory factor
MVCGSLVEVKLFAQLVAALDEGRRIALATVVGTAGSTPRHLGARMAVADDGATWGTIGGGRIELEVTAVAREIAAGAPPRRVQHHLVRDLAMCCGGSMEVAIADAAASRDALVTAAKARRERAPVLLDTSLDGGPLRCEPAERAAARAWRRPRVDGEVLREAIGLAERVLVFGAGHVGRAIGELAHRCDFEVIVCDDGDTGALDRAAPWADHVVDSFQLADAARALGGLGAGDLVLIVTRDHAVDQRIVEELLAGPAGVDVDELDFVGMIGSRGKVGRFRKRLEARGLLAGAGGARWGRLRAPVGLDVGAETPEEIAVAVVAQLVALRRRGEPAAGAWT